MTMNADKVKEIQRLQIMQVVQNFLDDALTSRAATSPYFLVKTDTPIIAGYSVYRESEFIRSSFDSICMYVNAILVMDGKYLDFEELPEDDTYHILADCASRFDPRWFASHVIDQKFVYLNTDLAYGPMLEEEKRDLMLQTVKNRGFLFILNGDEVCIGDVKNGLDFVRANPETKIFWVKVDYGSEWKYEPRIIKVEPGLHYGSTPSLILDKKNEVFTDSVFRNLTTDRLIQDFSILNLASRRSGERALARSHFLTLKEEAVPS